MACEDKEDFLAASSTKRIVCVLMQVRLLYAGGCKNAWVTLGIGRQASKRDKKKAIVARENNLQMFVNNIERY